MVFSHDATKKCIKCNEILSAELFYRKGERVDSRCKSCVSIDKRNKYILKHKVNNDCITNIVIQSFQSQVNVKRSDLILELTAFLLEEFHCGQRISG